MDNIQEAISELSSGRILKKRMERISETGVTFVYYSSFLINKNNTLWQEDYLQLD
jgi:hypothetical protein